MRKKVIRLKKAENSKIQTQHIVQILDEFARAATPTNIISSFRNAGIDRLLEKMIGPGGDVICHRLCRVNARTCRCLLTNAFDTEGIFGAVMAEENDSEFELEEEDHGAQS
jgi:hypothetical protein